MTEADNGSQVQSTAKPETSDIGLDEEFGNLRFRVIPASTYGYEVTAMFYLAAIPFALIAAMIVWMSAWAWPLYIDDKLGTAPRLYWFVPALILTATSVASVYRFRKFRSPAHPFLTAFYLFFSGAVSLCALLSGVCGLAFA